MRLELDKVREDDRDRVMEIAEGTWNGHDYLPYVFDDWVKDEGFYCLRDEDGRIIALDKYTWHENGILWLEGYRVHPDYRGKGYGWNMAEAMERIIESLDYKAVRFMTSEANKASIYIGEKMGFKPIAKYHYLYIEKEEMERSQESIDEVYALKESDICWVIESMLNSEEYHLNKGQYLAMWTAYDITEALILREIRKGRGYYREGEKGLIFLYPYIPRDTMSSAFVSGNEEEVRDLLLFGMHQALSNGFQRYTLKTASKRVRSIAMKLGMRESDIGMAIIYERTA